MTDYKGQAPLLKERGQKKSNDGSCWIYDREIIKFIMKECGSSYSQEHLMLYLMGNKPNEWRCSTADVLDATGISDKASLSKVKKKLKERGWINYKAEEYIIVLYDNIREQMKAKKGCSQNNQLNKEKNQGCSENQILGCSENQQKGCSQNNYNNTKNNTINNTIPARELGNQNQNLSVCQKANLREPDSNFPMMVPEEKEEGTVENPIKADIQWLAERANCLVTINGNKFLYQGKYYIIAETANN